MSRQPSLPDLDYTLGETVYFRLDADPEPGLVTGIILQPDCVLYRVTWPDKQERVHYPLELSATPCYAGRDDEEG